MSAPAVGELLYTPSQEARERSRLGEFTRWLRVERGLDFTSYDDLHQWSVTDLPGFWRSIWDFCGVQADGDPSMVLADDSMPGARWFPDIRLNYAEHLMGRPQDVDRVAMHGYSQTRETVRVTVGELRAQVAAAQSALRALGVGKGDRVAGYLPNTPETAIAYIATISLGAVWASCAPEFGAPSVIDRFGQIEPAVLLAVSDYTYADKRVDRIAEVAEVQAAIPSIEHVIQLPYGDGALPGALQWADLLAKHAGTTPPQFERVPFDHPMVVLFSSGTTGLPKAIIHGHGGLLLEHLKGNALSWDLGPGDTFLWFSTTTWMMWNSLVSALLTGASIVMIDGNPAYPTLDWQFRVAAETGTTVLGLSPAFVTECRKQGVEPGAMGIPVREICAAGSPMSHDSYRWVYDQFGTT